MGDLKNLERDDVVYQLPGADLKGWKAHEDFILNGRGTVSDLKQNWKYLFGEGNHVVLAYGSKDERVAEVWANGSTTNKAIEP